MEQFMKKHTTNNDGINNIKQEVDHMVETQNYLAIKDTAESYAKAQNQVEKCNEEMRTYVSLIEKEREKILNGVENLGKQVTDAVRVYLSDKGKEI